VEDSSGDSGRAHATPCKWNANNANWAGCRNKVSDVWNNGFPERAEDVRLFYGADRTGSWVCLHDNVSSHDRADAR
jgi:hypothetical protein